MPGGSTLFPPAGSLRGTIGLPPDKSISHRAAIIGALCDSPVEIENFLDSDDTGATLAAIQACGVKVERLQRGRLVVQGAGLRGLRAPAGVIDAGNSGTTMRLLAGVLAGQDGCFTLDGDASLRRRPMDRIMAPLQSMGVRIESREGQFAPLQICGGTVHRVDYEMPVASAQVKSAVLLAGLYGDGPTVVREPAVCRNHTEIMLAAAGARVEQEGFLTKIYPARGLQLGRVAVPADFSSAAFFIVAATIVPGSRIALPAVGLNPTRTGLLDILEEMGANIDKTPATGAGGEPAGELHVASSALKGVRVSGKISGRAIDELPLVALAGAFAEGETIVSGASELRLKESDRIRGVVENLAGIGVDIEARPDGFAVQGAGGSRPPGGRFKSLGDHRLAMLGAVAGAASSGGVSIQGFDCVSVSYPDFRQGLMRLYQDGGWR